jgi:hypothetical protein
LEIDKVLSQLAPAIGQEEAHRLWLLYVMEEDMEKRREIEGIVSALAAKHLDQFFNNDKILLQPPGRTSHDGILMGTIFHGDEAKMEFHLNANRLNEHVFVGGATGSGKTNLGFLIVKQLLEKSIPFTVYSWKREYRGILRSDWPGARNICAYTVGREVAPFSFNPFEPPPGTPREQWNGRIVDVLSHSHFLGHGVRYILHDALSKLESPSTKTLYEGVRSMKAIGRRREWIDSALRAVADLSVGPSGIAFNGASGEAILTLLERPTILELDALSEDAKTFFVESLLAWMHQYRLTQGKRGSLLHVNLLEEAHRIILRRGWEQAETVMDQVFREIRELGEGIVFFDQNLSSISKAATGNAGTTILFRQKHGDDLRAGADMVLLNYKDRNWLGRLEVGWAVVRTPDEGPFLIKVPLVRTDLQEVPDSFLTRRFVSYSSKAEAIPLGQIERTGIPAIPGTDIEGIPSVEQLNDTEVALLRDIALYSSGVVDRYSRLKVSRNRGNAARKNLVHLSLVEEASVPTDNGVINLLLLTDKGIRYLTDLGHHRLIPSPPRVGGPEHRHWSDKTAEELRAAGFTIEREKHLPVGGFADIVASRKGFRAVIEIETGKSDAVKNADKNGRADFDAVIVIPTSKRARKKVIDQLRKQADQSA